MPCYRPIEVTVRRKACKLGAYPQVVPCGSCIGCRGEQSRQWAVRMMHENRMHEHSHFVTLTIADEHLNENAEVCARDLSGFVRNLRKTQQRRISFFGCGEYGEKTARPHYHAVLFGAELLDRDIGFDSSRPDVWRSQTLDDLWGRGIAEGGSVTFASASYVAGYMRKKVKQARYQRANPLTGELKAPEFARMSLRPAIAKRWIEKWWRDVYPRDFVVVNGHEAKPPRYYDKFMDLEDDKGGTAERRDMFDAVKTRRYDEAVEMDAYQMMSGEKIHQARVNLFQARDQI